MRRTACPDSLYWRCSPDRCLRRLSSTMHVHCDHGHWLLVSFFEVFASQHGASTTLADKAYFGLWIRPRVALAAEGKERNMSERI